MSSGNPMGLAEISHFGSFQRVGGKAGGFINKKFFHPSSIRNQEKLWKAATADEREKRKQLEHEKRRDEERQVEELRKQMYLAGQGKSGDFLTTAAEEKAAIGHLGADQKNELKQALAEQQKRRALLKQQAADKTAQASPDGDSDEEDEAPVAGDNSRKLAKSRYREDVHEQGHNTVWGSWYSTEDKRWGFKCCKLQERDATCPLYEEPEVKSKDEHRGKRRRRGGGGAADGGDADGSVAEGRGSSSSTARAEAPQEEAEAAKPVQKIDPATLLDTRMLEAAAKRQRVNSFKEMQQQNRSKEEVQKTGYLADLLQDPAAG